MPQRIQHNQANSIQLLMEETGEIYKQVQRNYPFKEM
jgi:NTP pyrophosphatase (non-canonical NTP hydrolase)